MEASLQKFQISDSKLEHNDWVFPATIKTRPLGKADEDEFLNNHKIDQSYDESTVNFKLLFGNALKANLSDTSNLPFDSAVVRSIKSQGWISDEYLHLWRRDTGGSAALTSHGVLSFILQTPRDGGHFCSLSLVNREKSYCGGLFVADDAFNLQTLLSSQLYLNRHPKVPKDFAILPFQILVHHVGETLSDTNTLAGKITSAEKRIADGKISLEDNGDYKLLNRLNLEQFRLSRRSHFELELAENLSKYIEAYHHLWKHLWEGGTGYIDDMREKIEQQKRYSAQIRKDLDMMPRRIDNQSKAMFNFIAQRDNRLNLLMAESSKKIAEESRLDNLLNVRLAKATAQVAEVTRQDSAAMKTIAILTLTFLPGTAVASIFSMNNMFNWSPSPGQPIASPLLWVFFVVTIPLTVLVFGLWLWWFHYTQQKFQKQNSDSDLVNIEKELMNRMRTATAIFGPP